MISEQQQEQASLYVLGALTVAERDAFETEVRAKTELRSLVLSLQRTTGLMAMASPSQPLPGGLRDKVLQRIEREESAAKTQSKAPIPFGFKFRDADEKEGWKELPVPGAWIKLLSIERDRGYAVLLGKLEPGVRYPAHTNVSAEDIYLLTGDLHVNGRRLGPGDFHHADAGSEHDVNYSVEGCTLISVLAADHPLVAFAMA